MHAGERCCGLFRYDGVIEMQVEGLEALENAVNHDSPARAARQIVREGLYRSV
jgi:hypothetical protein